MENIDTAEGIEAYLEKGLPGLRELLTLRRKASGNGFSGRLQDWLLFGSMVLDASGGLNRAEVQVHYKADPEYAASLKKVVTVKEVLQPFEGHYLSISWGGNILPAEGKTCPGCSRPWEVSKLGDVIVRFDYHQDSQVAWHRDCLTWSNALESRDYWTVLLSEAGYNGHVIINEIPNQYDSNSSYSRPWASCRLRTGTLVLGWRKRVIHIDWSGIEGKPDLQMLFASEEVTKEPTFVHAWSREKAIEYLRLLHPYLIKS